MYQKKQSVGIFTTNHELLVQSWDSWLAAVTGLTAENVCGSHLMELFPEAKAWQKIFERVLKTNVIEEISPNVHPYLIPCAPQFYSKQFQRMQQHVTIAPLRDQDRLLGTIVTIKDVTPQVDLNLFTKQPKLLRVVKSAKKNLDLELFKALDNENWQIRRAAVEDIIKNGDQSAINELVNKIQGEHKNLRILNSALQALTQIDGDIITPLSKLLKISDADLRGYVAMALGDQNDRRAIPLLIEALKDENPNVKYNAIEALGKLQAREAVFALAEWVESGEFFLAFVAIDALKNIGDPSITPILLARLHDEQLRVPIIEALGELGDESVVTSLVNLLNLSNAPTIVIAQALSTIWYRYKEFYDDANSITELIRKTINSQGIQNLLETLNHSKASEDLSALALVLGNSSSAIEALKPIIGKLALPVIKALAKLDIPVTALLIEQLEDNQTNKEDLRLAISTLEKLADPAAVPALMRLLSVEEDDEILVMLLKALKKTDNLLTLEPLLNLLNHPNPEVRHESIEVLNALNPPNLIEQICKFLHDSDSLLRESALRIVGYIGSCNVINDLLACCNDENLHVRQAAIEALPVFEGHQQVLPTLTKALKQGEAKIRAAAARAMAAIDDPSVISILQSALSDSYLWTRYFAVQALGKHGAVESLEQLSEIANSSQEAMPVRFAAIEALEQIGMTDVDTIAVLAKLSKSETDIDLVTKALNALGKLGAATPLLAVLDLKNTAVVKKQVIRNLRYIQSASVVTKLQALLMTETDAEIVQELINTLAHLGDLGSFEAISTLITMTISQDWREICVELLSQSPSKSHQVDKIKAIAAGLEHVHPAARSATVRILAQLNNPLAVKYLIKALNDKEVSVRLTAVTVLKSLSQEELTIRGARAKLLEMVTEEPNIVVRRAVQKLLTSQNK